MADLATEHIKASVYRIQCVRVDLPIVERQSCFNSNFDESRLILVVIQL